jgi:hypothetical protein
MSGEQHEKAGSSGVVSEARDKNDNSIRSSCSLSGGTIDGKKETTIGTDSDGVQGFHANTDAAPDVPKTEISTKLDLNFLLDNMRIEEECNTCTYKGVEEISIDSPSTSNGCNNDVSDPSITDPSINTDTKCNEKFEPTDAEAPTFTLDTLKLFLWGNPTHEHMNISLYNTLDDDELPVVLLRKKKEAAANASANPPPQPSPATPRGADTAPPSSPTPSPSTPRSAAAAAPAGPESPPRTPPRPLDSPRAAIDTRPAPIQLRSAAAAAAAAAAGSPRGAPAAAAQYLSAAAEPIHRLSLDVRPRWPAGSQPAAPARASFDAAARPAYHHHHPAAAARPLYPQPPASPDPWGRPAAGYGSPVMSCDYSGAFGYHAAAAATGCAGGGLFPPSFNAAPAGMSYWRM